MIELTNISKTFKVAKRTGGFGEAVKSLFRREVTYVHALDGVSFTVGDGEMVGYIGPNGAGKSSTVKVMSGILTPDSGECVIDGLCPWKDRKAHVKNIGVVFGQRSQLWWDVPVIDSFELIRDIYAVPEAVYLRNRNRLTEMLDLGELLKTPARQLSLGQRMRCEIAASLLHDPKILFLDEPTIGLDAVSKIAVRDFIRELNRDYRNMDSVTDVLSFPQFEQPADMPEEGEICLGDVVICKEQAERQAEEFGHSFEREIIYLFTHSVLHLLGYDHMTEEDKAGMRAKEEAVMNYLGIGRQ